MEYIYILRFGDQSIRPSWDFHGFCFRSYGEAASYLNEFEGMFIRKVTPWDGREFFYRPENDDFWAKIVKVPIAKNKLERKKGSNV